MLDCKAYPMTRDEDTALEKFLDEMVAKVLRLVGRSVRRARGGVILKSTTNKGGLL
jgi:hypothetical protein